MYRWLIYFHILGVFGFLISHAASVHMAFAVRKERNLDRLRALLQISSSSYSTMYPSLLVIVLTGIVAGFQADWWRFGWIWASLVILIAIVVAMGFLGAASYGAVKYALGMRRETKGQLSPEAPVMSQAEIEATLQKTKPILLAVIGYGGLALLAWLMMFKPF